MAKIVQVMGVTHNPNLFRILQEVEKRPGAKEVKEKYAEMRQKLSEARPDVVVIIGHDHVNQWFMNNMPAFLVGKAPVTEGPFDHQEAELGVPHYRARIDVDVARSILEGGLERNVDFAYSDEFRIDHAYCVPLALLRPEMDLPIVPIFINCFAPPVPRPRRCYQVGEVIRDVLETEVPADKRVAVVASGHLSIELGGPKVMDKPVDDEFDARVVEQIRRADLDGVCREATYERSLEIGNYSVGVVDYIMAMAIARCRPPSQAEGLSANSQTMGFFLWDLEKEGVA